MLAIAENKGRFYRVSVQQMRYFPIRKADAELLLATGQARKTPYLPFSRPDLYEAYKLAQAGK